MANETELEKIDRAAEYFERYFEFEDAVTVSKENKEYLKTYIHDNDYVVKNFNIKISAPAIMPTIISFVPRSSHSSRCTYFYRCRRFRYRSQQIQTYCC